jgi:hypothetical protein
MRSEHRARAVKPRHKIEGVEIWWKRNRVGRRIGIGLGGTWISSLLKKPIFLVLGSEIQVIAAL